MSLGKRLVLLRKRNAMTQEQLAQLLGTTRQAVSKWESEKSTPDMDSLIRIGSTFHVSMDFLLLGKESVPSDTKHQVQQEHQPHFLHSDTNRHLLILFLILLTIGTAILLLLPLLASLYKNAASWPRYTDANLYLHEWPLLGVVILGVMITSVGICGITWIYRKKVRKFIDECLF